MINLSIKVVDKNDIPQLTKLSTENLIIWVVGTSQVRGLKLSIEEIVLECWLINPEKHSLRGFHQFPDSFVVMKRIFDMKGRKGLIGGSTQDGFQLTEISKSKYNSLAKKIRQGLVISSKSGVAANRTINSLEETPYKRLVKTPAYKKFSLGLKDQIVESDFLYFYGVTWSSSIPHIEGKIRNIDKIVDTYSKVDSTLQDVRTFLKTKFNKTMKQLKGQDEIR